MPPRRTARWQRLVLSSALLVTRSAVCAAEHVGSRLPPTRLLALRSKAQLRSNEHRAGTLVNGQAGAAASQAFEYCLNQTSSKSRGDITACHNSVGMSEETLCSWYLEAKCAHSDNVAALNPICSGVDEMCQARVEHHVKEGPKLALIESGTHSRHERNNDDEGEHPAVEAGARRVVDADAEPQAGTTNPKPMMFLHIPKNAGTAVEEAGRKVGVRWGRNHPELSFLRPMSTGEYCMRYHVPPSYLTRRHVYQEAETFCITRNPYDRAVSEYTYLLNKEWAKGYLFLYDKPACTAEGLNYFLQMSLRRVQLGWKFTLDCHMLPQSEWIWEPNGKKWCDNMMKLEELPGAFDKLMESRGSASRLSSEKENASGDGACHGLTMKDLDSVSKEMIENVYYEDFDRLGYQQEVVDISQYGHDDDE